MAEPSSARVPVFAVVGGGGAIGGFMAACLHHAGYEVRCLLRESARSRAWLEVLKQRGLVAKCSSEPTFQRCIPSAAVPKIFSMDAAAVLSNCSAVLVATKRGGNEALQKQLSEHLGERCPVVFLQNGLNIRQDFAASIPFQLIESVVNFNVTQDDKEGTVTLTQALKDAHLTLPDEPSSRWLAEHLSSSVQTDTSHVFAAVQRGKLVLNMTNAVNALCGRAIAPMYFDPDYRRILAASMREAQAVFKAEGIPPQASRRQEAFLLRWIVPILLSPQWLFEMTMGRKLKGRGDGFTSMAQDLKAGRVPTEVAYLNGAVIEVGKATGVPTPVNERLLALLQEAEKANRGCPGISGAELLRCTGQAVQVSSPLGSGLKVLAAAVLLGVAVAAARRGEERTSRL